MAAKLGSASGLAFADALVQRAVARGANAAQADHSAGEYFEIEADARRVNLARSVFRDETSITVFCDGKKGSSSLTGRDDEAVELEIRDDGRGFDREAARDRPGLGLASMEERATLLGGTLSVTSEPGSGTTVTARIPLES